MEGLSSGMCGGTGVCREAGARVTTNVFRDLNLAEFRGLDGRRIEVIADGLSYLFFRCIELMSAKAC